MLTRFTRAAMQAEVQQQNSNCLLGELEEPRAATVSNQQVRWLSGK